MAEIDDFIKKLKIAVKDGHYIALIHKEDGTVEFKILKQDIFVPERLIEVNQKKGFSVEGRDNQIYIMPKGEEVELAFNGRVRVINYIEGYIQAIKAKDADSFHKLMDVVGKYNIPNGTSLPILLFDAIDVDKSVEWNLDRVNCGLTEDNGFSVDYTVDEMENYMALKRELIETRPSVFKDVKQLILHIQENASIIVQNLIARYLYIEAEKRGQGVLGQILSNKKTATIIMVIAIAIVLILSQVKPLVG
ncbi:MAG: hypothetical protein Q4P17_04000 [Methanobacterium sp.]|nr:hypothetical protein [Methanobacterium sp.]